MIKNSIRRKDLSGSIKQIGMPPLDVIQVPNVNVSIRSDTENIGEENLENLSKTRSLKQRTRK